MSESGPTRRSQRTVTTEATASPAGEAQEPASYGPRRTGTTVVDHADDRTFGATEWRPAEGIPAATVAAAPRRPGPPISRRPVFAPIRTEQPPAGATDGPTRIGWDPGRTSLAAATGAIRPLESAEDVLPELEESQTKPRPVWRHPAFLVSAGTTLLALIALVVFLVLGMMNPRPAVSGLVVETGDDNARVSWSGPDVAYQLVVVGGPAGEQLDVSQLVRGTEAWIPVGFGYVDERSCIVVRPADGNETAPVSLDAETLAEQGGASACLADD